LFYETSELTKSFLYVDCDQSLEYRIVQLYCPDPKWSMGIGWEEDQSALDPLFFQLNFSNAPHAIHLQQRGSKTTLGYSLSGGNWTLQIQIASGIYQPKSTVLWQAQN
jgi:hypothetical protein